MKLTLLALAGALVAVSSGATKDDRAAATAPVACTLLKAAELEPLTGGAKVSNRKPDTLPDEMGTVCSFTWGATSGSGQISLKVILNDTSKMFPGMSREAIKRAMMADVKPGNQQSAVIPGISDLATYDSDAPTRASVHVYLKGSMVQLVLEGPGARGKKDPLVALLKLAVSRL